ncbi:MAG TPA: putative lipid II flippase FtsW [Candidatus Methylacidiphilales bacterium]|nr:putative lipid II flippase FtsW [Candidatus Methylacidiphilales bacterium]
MFVQRNVAYVLLITMLGLIAIGLVMLSSTSSVLATGDMVNVYSNLRKQCAWLIIGGIACVLLSRCDYQKVLRCAPVVLAIAAGLLTLCLVPHIGVRVNGSPRWLRLAGWTYQPSEFAKLALILFLSWWMGKNQRHAHEFLRGFLWPVLGVAPLLLLVAKQQDLGTASIMLLIAVVIMFCAGTNLLYLLPAPVMGLAGLLLTSILIPERWQRWMAFLHPEQHRDGAGYQQWQALIALGSGGWEGLGLGNSRQKMYYLPEVNTDFVFPIIGEELGMWVTLTIVLAFVIMLLCSGWITLHAPDPAGVLLGAGITAMIALQAMMNLAVVTSLMPCKGLPLPFISYGGSNLLTCLAAMGLLFNLHRQGPDQTPRQPVLIAKSYSVRM